MGGGQQTSRLRTIAACVILLLIFVAGCTLAIHGETDWSGLGEPATSIEIADLEQNLDAARAEEGRVRQRAVVPIAWFRLPEGRTVRLVMREMSFESKRIVGLDLRSDQTAAIVSSVDRKVYRSYGSSGPILQGCDLVRLEGTTLLPGSVRRDRCRGDYARAGIDDVLSVAIVTFSNERGSRACIENGTQQTYIDCTLEELRFGLERTFALKSSSGDPYNVLILPELATGAGGISKTNFYDNFFRVFRSELKNVGARSSLPDQIIVQVWSGDRSEGSYRQTMDGIRRYVQPAIDEWRQTPHPKPASAWLRVTGIAGGLAFAIAALLTSARFGSAFPALQPLAAEPTLIIVLAWSLICFGLADGLSGLLPVPARWDSSTQIAIGFIIVLVAAPLIRAVKNVQRGLESTQVGR